MESFVGPGREFVQHIAQVGEGLYPIEFTGLDQGVEGCYESFHFHQVMFLLATVPGANRL